MMTPEQIGLARHALGLSPFRKTSYRNHFVAGTGHPDYENWRAMVSAGWARQREKQPHTGGQDVFWLTLAGALQALRDGEKLDEEDFPDRAT